ncbi:DUF1007 family protein [Sneathiella chinensis]|uniref:ABC transporter substrate-binding protein n=1 Tax=Sneathiella chinensis TaxID=349750 RepID=A0ABQ5U8A1_9PROT|nr:DUF1007 family protein [Sneathiella chinensis]GLQ07420.1 hypothetical protein GCM10007924_26410 [Sneathiella chinensis]
MNIGCNVRARRGKPLFIAGKLVPAFFTLLLCLAAGSSPVRAHPHGWIDLRSTVILDAAGHITALEQEWLFDPLYSTFVMEDLSGTAESQRDALTTLAGSNLQELRSYNYFTEVRADDVKIDLGEVSEYESELRNGRVWMRFVVPLATPVSPTLKTFEFAVFDPTYYTEILHLEGDIITFRGDATGGCFGRIMPPNPTTEAILLAQTMDRDATPDTTLGSVFAERVEVSCK